MFKKTINVFTAGLLVASLVISGVSFVKTANLDLLSEAQAQYGMCEMQVEIIAGTTGSITGYANPDFGGSCLPGVISGGSTGPGVVNFNEVFDESGFCSDGDPYTRYVTTEYDATNFPNIAEPYTFTANVQSIQDSGGECVEAYGTIRITVVPDSPTPSFVCDPSPITTTIDPGSNTSYAISTTPFNGFNSPVNFTASISPNNGTVPTVVFSNNGQVPSATTTAMISTGSNTTPGTYSIAFTGSGGGQSASCSVQLVVNPATKDFQLRLSPQSGIISPPNRSSIGTTPVFTVFADCTGGFNGPVTDLIASTTFGGVTLTLGATSLACGATTTLTVNNTLAVPDGQLSTPINTLMESLSVSGRGLL